MERLERGLIKMICLRVDILVIGVTLYSLSGGLRANMPLRKEY